MGPARTEMWRIPFKAKDPALADFSRFMVRITSQVQGPGGHFEVDDAENWASMQRAFRGAASSEIPQVLAMGSPEHIDELAIEDWAAPGVAINSVYTDSGNRRFHQLWRDAMNGASR